MSIREKLLAHSIDGAEASSSLGPCRLWARSKNNRGYGVVSVNRKSRLAHRIAYEAFVGPIPSGFLVLHHCDVRTCIRPAHLFLGTSADNTADMMAKGRHVAVRGERHGSRTKPERVPRGAQHGTHTKPERRPCGERNASAKLTADAVRAIRIDARLNKLIAHEYGVHGSVVSRVKSGKAWGHVK